MKDTINLFRIIHRITLAIFLVIIALVPLITHINAVTAFVILPAFMIFTFILSILIEQKLDGLALQKTTIKKTRACRLRKCFHKNCLS